MSQGEPEGSRTVKGRHIHCAAEGGIRREKLKPVMHPEPINAKTVVRDDPQLEEMITASRCNTF